MMESAGGGGQAVSAGTAKFHRMSQSIKKEVGARLALLLAVVVVTRFAAIIYRNQSTMRKIAFAEFGKTQRRAKLDPYHS